MYFKNSLYLPTQNIKELNSVKWLNGAKTFVIKGLSLFLLSLILSAINPAFSQECDVIYVTPAGSPAAAGTRANPTDLLHGLSLVSATANRVWLAAGTYNISQTLQIPSDVTIEGGFAAGTWIKSNSAASIIHKDATNALPPPAFALIAVGANGASNFRLQDLTITVDNASTPQISVYGLGLVGCSNYFIVRCTINTGNGGDGAPGALGAPGVVGAPGGNGLPAANENSIPAGGIGGTGGNPGGNGGEGARHSPQAAANGSAGGGACGGAGGSLGDGPNCGCGIFGSSNGMIKSLVFGVAVTFIALLQGYVAQPTPDGVASATTRSVVISSLSVLGLDFILTVMMFSI